MIKPAIYLRTASVLTLIHAVLHTIGGVFGTPEPGAAATAFAAMQSNHFLLMGHDRSYAEFYMGLGLFVTFALTSDAIVFWMLGSLMSTDSARLRPILALFLVEYLVIAVNSYRFFFMAPVIVELIIALCFVMAIVGAGKSAAQLTA
jgi:hypothetical protein